MSYPTARAVKIKINDTDRTLLVDVHNMEIEDVLTDQANIATFNVKNAEGIGLAGLQTVVISNVAEDVRYFAGVVTKPTDSGKGPRLHYALVCTDFTWYLDHPEDLYTAKHTNDSDQTIIQAAMAACCPQIDATTHVAVVKADTGFFESINQNPRQILQSLAALAGAEWYVDYGPGPGSQKAYLHYFASGTNAAPFGLSDVVADPPADPYPYDDLERTDDVPDVNRVKVVGRHSSQTRMYATDQDTNQGNLSYTTEGADKTFADDAQDFAAWMEQGGSAAYLIIVTNSDGSESWGYLGAAVDIDDTEQGNLSYTTENSDQTFTDDGQDFTGWASSYRIYVVNSDGTLSWGYLHTKVSNTEIRVTTDVAHTTPGWNGVAVSGKTPSSYNVVDNNNQTEVRVYEELALTTSGWNGDTITAKTPSSYKVWKSKGDYDYWINAKLVDNGLLTDAQLRARGDQYLADVAAGVSYTCTIEEPGLVTGMDVTLVNALRSVNASFMVRRVTTRWTSPKGYATFNLELGARRRRMADVIVRERKIWDEEQILPRHPGIIQMEDAGTDIQTDFSLTTYNDQVDYPSLVEFLKSHTDDLGTLTETIANEILGQWNFKGVETGGDWATPVTFQVTQDGAAAADYIAGILEILLSDTLGNQLELELKGEDSLMELLDGGTDRNPDFTLTAYNDQTDYAPVLTLRKSHDDTIETLTATIDAEELGALKVYGVESGGDWQLAAFMKLVQDGAAGADSIDALWQSDSPFCLMGQEELRFYEGANYVGFEAPALAADQIWVLPDADGTVGQVPYTDGAGNIAWGSLGDIDSVGTGTDNHIVLWDGTDALQDSNLRVVLNTIYAPASFDLEAEAGRMKLTASSYIWLDCSPGTYFYLTAGTYINMTAHGSFIYIDADDYIGLDQNEGVGIGATSHPTANPADVLFFATKANDPTMAVNTAGIYAKDVAASAEMFAIDEGGAASQLTPHDPITGEWIALLRNHKGAWMKVQMEQMMRRLNDMLGGGFIEEWVDWEDASKSFL